MIPARVREGQVMKKPNKGGRVMSDVIHGIMATFLVSDFITYVITEPTNVPSPPAGIAASFTKRVKKI